MLFSPRARLNLGILLLLLGVLTWMSIGAVYCLRPPGYEGPIDCGPPVWPSLLMGLALFIAGLILVIGFLLRQLRIQDLAPR